MSEFGTSGHAPAASSRTRRDKQPQLVWVGATLVFWLLAGLTFVTSAVQLGLRQTELSIAGPFPAETTPPTQALTLLVPGEHALPWWRQPLIGDSVEKPFESSLRLKINGMFAGPAHMQHALIRAGGKGFSHWGRRVIFSLPPGVENAATTTAVLQYPIKPRLWITLSLCAFTVLFGWLLYREQVQQFWRSRVVRRQIASAAAMARGTSYVILLGLCFCGLAGVSIFVASSLYAFASGWALPTTALIRGWSVAAWAAANEPYLPYLLLSLAGFGALTTWLTRFDQTGRLERDEARVQRIVSWAGLPIAMGAFAFCTSAMWSGHVRPGDLEWASMGGLVPFSDALDHLAGAFEQARDGTFNAFALRRPFAAAQRSVLLFFSQYSLPGMLLLQACLLGAAAWWTSCAVMAWRGLWAGLAFFSLTYIYARLFSSTTLSEPLGLFWGMLSVPFFIGSFLTGSVRPAMAGFALTVLALMTRMGNMFAIPALMLWLVWQFGRGVAAKARIGLLSIAILLAMFGLNSLLQKAYGTADASTGSNFSYTICGLTLGTTWEGCPKKIMEARDPGAPAPSERALIAQMYTMAWDNFRAHPEVFFRRLGDAVHEFYFRFPSTIWKGYLERVVEPEWFLRRALIALILVGLWFVATRQANSKELSFWVLLCASLTASAGIVAFDDGTRVLAVSHPMVALLLASGFANWSPANSVMPSAERLTLYGGLGLLTAAILMATVPWIAHQVAPVVTAAGSVSSPRRTDVFVYGGKRMSGFLVVADSEPLRRDIPSLHLSEFAAILEASRIEETLQGLLNPVTPALPFGFVTAPRMERGAIAHPLYIVPLEVMERREVPAWRFEISPWNHKPDVKGNYWFNVIRAEPVTLKGQ